MTEFLPRSAWTDQPFPNGATIFDPEHVEGLALHWPGGGKAPTTSGAAARMLAGELAFHTRLVSQGGRGWSDIAYNFAIDQAGRVWELRGLTRRSAANGDTDVNRRFVAATCLIGPDDEPSPQLQQAVRDLRAKVLARYPKATRVTPHSAIRPNPTDCPGDQLRALISVGAFTVPTTRPVRPPMLHRPRTARIEDAMLYKIDNIVYVPGGDTTTDGKRKLYRVIGGPADQVDAGYHDYADAGIPVVNITLPRLRALGYAVQGSDF